MGLEEQLKEDLNEAQYQAAMHMNGPAVIIAGAGSGKTHTLMGRVAHLVDNWIPPQRILMLTFTNAAADEMKNRASKLLDERCGEITACTYHKFCNTMLRKYGRAIEVQNYSILSPAENKNLIDYVKSSSDTYKDLRGFPSSKTIVSIISKSVNCQMSIYDTLLSDDNWGRYIDYSAELEQLKEEVAKYSFETQKFNYDDLLLYMNKLLDIDEYAKKVASLFDHIMIDEFQDTNNLQEEILVKLSKFNKNIMVVGDISQSIYAFRGANVKNLQNFGDLFEDCALYVLSTNYRSTQEILDLANNVMRTSVCSWEYYDMVADNKNGNKPVLLRPYDEFDQTQKILQTITKLRHKGLQYKDIAILERGSMSSFGLEAELNKLGIAYEKRGGMKFMDYECIGDMLAYMTIIVKPYDLLSWFRVLKLHPYIGDVTAKKIADNCKSPDFLIDKRYKNNKFYSELDMLNTDYQAFRSEKDFHKVFDMIVAFYFETRQRAIEHSRMKEEYREDAKIAIERDKTIVEQLKTMTMRYDKINDFLDDLILDSVSNSEQTDDMLVISTVHSAKGLEWEAVIILDCINGLFPSYISEEEQFGSEADEEELRCFYVSITRAKRYLYLSSPRYRMVGGFAERTTVTHYLEHSLNYLDIV